MAPRPKAKKAQKGAPRAQTTPSSLWAQVTSLPDTPFPSTFSTIPLSPPTLRGLAASSYKTPTPIQAASLPYTLKGKDVLGAARTGSGKTVAFLVAVLERLWREKWAREDGVGAVVLSPTRELAMQIFDVLRQIGRFHNFSAGLLIGGKSLEEEQARLGKMNILVCTPGRLLQHLDQTAGFDVANLMILVLDEADRLLDMGFQSTLTAIIEHLPRTSPRQTLLFSATQTKRVKDLAKLSLKDPEYVAVRDKADDRIFEGKDDEGDRSVAVGIPKSIQQRYTVVGLEKKIDVLWGFVKSHLTSKTLVFLSSCKQVRFVYETFRHMRPGVSLLHLHGKQKLATRLSIYERFLHSSNSCLFATDVASRGLDFPSVDWVVQADCPEDVDTHIHRVGRTARGEGKAGNALLMLTPGEEKGFRKRLEERGMWEEMKSIKIKENKVVDVTQKVQGVLFKFPEVKFLAQRAFISYVRSIYLQKDKTVFSLDSLPLEEFAKSLGLAGAPRIKFVGKGVASQKKNQSRTVAALKGPVNGKGKEKAEEDVEGNSEVEVADESESESEVSEHEGKGEEEREAGPSEAKKIKTKYDRMFARKNQGVLSEHYNKIIDRSSPDNLNGDGEEDDDFMVIKRRDHELPDSLPASDHISKRQERFAHSKKAQLRKGGLGTKVVFDDETGEATDVYKIQTEEKWKEMVDGKEDELERMFVEAEREHLRTEDVEDRMVAKMKKREKKEKQKRRRREDMEDDVDMAPRLPSPEVEPWTEEPLPPVREKKRKKDADDDLVPVAKKRKAKEDADLEALALKALSKRR
ncbi:DEAD-domain-containing protein [Atractiella rhizophila]|nr:DEAD-domain-containing protein [Atractiella rhizophila]